MVTALARVRLAVALSGALASVACTRHAAPTRVEPPPGILVPADARVGQLYRGLYLGDTARTGTWTMPDMTISMRKSRSAQRLVLILYVPDTTTSLSRWYHAHPVALDVRFSDGAGARACCFTGGVAGAHFTLTHDLRALRGTVTFHVHVDGAVVLHRVDRSASDTRRLGVVLLRAFFY